MADRHENDPYNNGRPSQWIADPLPGGWVCGVPDARYESGICGTPIETVPCSAHNVPIPAAAIRAAAEVLYELDRPGGAGIDSYESDAADALTAALPHLGSTREEFAVRVVLGDGRTDTVPRPTLADARAWAARWITDGSNATVLTRTRICGEWTEVET